MPSSSSNIQRADEAWMRLALAEARRGEGATRPNPAVGAVVVKSGIVVGRGYHQVAGGPHAEIHALRAAGRKARGATLYITLEPCCTHGRTPPCTDAILAAGIKTVVYAVADPNPSHAGRALRLLRKKGVEVRQGVCLAEAGELLAPFAKWITTRRPFVTLKLALSLDGRLADLTGRSKWISSPPSREIVQQMRKRVDAIMVGGNTARVDDPGLTVTDGTRTPFRVILDSAGRLDPRSRVLTDTLASRTIIATTARCSQSRATAYRRKGATVLICKSRAGAVSLGDLFKRLGEMGILHVLCEGGGVLAAALLREHSVDRMLLFYAPLLLGGTGLPAAAGSGWHLDRAPKLDIMTVERVGPDVVLHARVRK